MIILIILLLFSCNIYSGGFSGNILLLTDQGQIRFDQLDTKTLVQVDTTNFQHVLFLSKQSVEQVIQIRIGDEIITCHPKQIFWCVNKNEWISAKDLNSSDLLQIIDEQHIEIDNVQLVQQQTEIYSLSVGPPHYLYVGKHAVLAHNVIPYVFVATVPVASTLVVKIATTAVGTGLVTFGAWVANLFAKNRNHKKQRAAAVQSACNGPLFFNPNDDNKNKHPNGIYEDADYHGLTPNGRKSARPKDGQKALDNSYAFGKDLTGRIAIQDGEFVVLRSHSPGKFHGYRCEWRDIPQQAKNILQDLGLTNHKGKIL